LEIEPSHAVHATATFCELALAESIVLHAKFSEWKKHADNVLAGDVINTEDVMTAARQTGFVFVMFVFIATWLRHLGKGFRYFFHIVLPFIAIALAFLPLIDMGYGLHLDQRYMFWSALLAFLLTTAVAIDLHSLASAESTANSVKNTPLKKTI
jgi:uncharacterized membrane protein